MKLLKEAIRLEPRLVGAQLNLAEGLLLLTADLKKGDHVSVAYTTAGNHNQAHRIDLESASAVAGKMPSPGARTTPTN